MIHISYTPGISYQYHIYTYIGYRVFVVILLFSVVKKCVACWLTLPCWCVFWDFFFFFLFAPCWFISICWTIIFKRVFFVVLLCMTKENPALFFAVVFFFPTFAGVKILVWVLRGNAIHTRARADNTHTYTHSRRLWRVLNFQRSAG